jgi:hypothetical protein
MREIDLYLDLDGVILRRTGHTDFKGRTEFEVAPNAMEFLSWAVENFNCYWLTSRSHDGSYGEIERAFRLAIPAANLPDNLRMLIRAIRPASWGSRKVEGIDMSREFYWADDNPDQASEVALENIRLQSRLIIASTDQRLEDLARIRTILESS